MEENFKEVESKKKNNISQAIFDNNLIDLPKTEELNPKNTNQFDEDNGIHRSAIDHMDARNKKSYMDYFKLVIPIFICFFFLYNFFPWTHFFKVYRNSINEEGSLPPIFPRESEFSEVAQANKIVIDLIDKGKAEEALVTSREYVHNLEQDDYEKWQPVWQLYLRLLFELKYEEELFEQSSRLKEILPDNFMAVFYPARYRINLLKKEKISNLKRTEKNEQKSKLDDIIENCQKSETTLVMSKIENKDNLHLIQLLIAEAYQKLWWLSNYSWKDINREKAFDYLRKIPDNSKFNSDKKRILLSIYKDCYSKWPKGLFGISKKSIIINRKDRNYKGLENLIEDME